MSEPQKFLETLWGEGIEGGHLLLWTLPDKQSHWHTDLAAAALHAARLAPSYDVYVGVGLASSSLGPHRRARASEVSAIPGLVADLDVAGPGHRGVQLFESLEAADDFLGALPLAPTLTVASGGGLHAWWLLREPALLEDDEDRTEAVEMSLGWARLLGGEAEKRGYKLDAVWDLARILRVPGTINHKDGRRREVRMLRSDGPRYNVSDFEPWRARGQVAVTVPVETVKLDSGAEPPFDLFQALCELEPRFDLTWRRQRRDAKGWSASEYDLALATMAAHAEWSAQQIANLLIAHRRKHGDALKLRENYYRLTIAKAMASRTTVEIQEEVDELLDQPAAQAAGGGDTPPPPAAPPGESEREKILQLIRDRTGVPAAKIVLHSGDPGRYSVVLAGGRDVSIGGSSNLMSFAKWAVIAFEHGQVVERPKGAEWKKVLRGIQRVIEVQTAVDATERAIMRGWVRDYAGRAPEMTGVNGSELAEHIHDGRPFEQSGKLLLQLSGLLGHLRVAYGRRLEPSELARILRVTGFDSTVVQARCEEKVVRRSYWVIELSQLEEE